MFVCVCVYVCVRARACVCTFDLAFEHARMSWYGMHMDVLVRTYIHLATGLSESLYEYSPSVD